MIADRTAFEPFIVGPAGHNECVTRSIITTYDDSKMSKIFHPPLAATSELNPDPFCVTIG